MNVDHIISGETYLITSRVDITDHVIHVRDSWGNSDELTYVVQQSDLERMIGSRHNAREKLELDDDDSQRRLQESRSKGEKKTMVVHVKTADGLETPFTVSQLEDLFFGADGSAENLKSRMGQCSYGQMRIEPYTNTDTEIQNGVYSLKLDRNAKNVKQNLVVDATLAALEQKFGDNLGRTFDHILICIPEGVVDPFIGKDTCFILLVLWVGSKYNLAVDRSSHSASLSYLVCVVPSCTF